MEQVAHNLVIQMFFVVGTPVLMKEKSIPTVTEKKLETGKSNNKKNWNEFNQWKADILNCSSIQFFEKTNKLNRPGQKWLYP